jgi:hypothetical protein
MLKAHRTATNRFWGILVRLFLSGHQAVGFFNKLLGVVKKAALRKRQHRA